MFLLSLHTTEDFYRTGMSIRGISYRRAPASEKVWEITNRNVIYSNITLNPYSTDETYYFWFVFLVNVIRRLPFISTTSEPFYSGCGGYEYSSDACGAFTFSNIRRFGNAGFIVNFICSISNPSSV